MKICLRDEPDLQDEQDQQDEPRLEEEQPHPPEEGEDAGDGVIFDVSPSVSLIVLWFLFWALLAVASWVWIPQALAGPSSRPATALLVVRIGKTTFDLFSLLGWGATGMGILHTASLLAWRGATRYVLAPDCVMVEKGILTKRGWTIPIDDIVEIKYERGLAGVLGRFGTMRLKVKDQDKPVNLEAFPGVAVAARAILSERLKYRRANRKPGPAAAKKASA